MTDPIVAFLEARLRDDEQTARAATPGPWAARAEPNAAHSTLYGEADVFGPDGRTVAADSDGGCADMVNAEHIARHDPTRVLADVTAKRTILDEHYPQNSDLFPEDGPQWCQTCPDRAGWPCATVKALLSVHRDHPDFDPSWDD